jgi:predicted nucleic acid-binding Zn ribbon protein
MTDSTDNNLGSSDPQIADAWIDFDAHRRAEERKYYGRSPKKIGNIIAQLVNRRGYAQIHAAGERDEAWQATAGEELAKMTQFSVLRRGVFEVLVANSLLMQELTFRKEQLLAGLHEALPESGIKQLKFKIGRIDSHSH